MNSFVFKTDELKKSGGFKGSLKADVKEFTNTFIRGKLKEIFVSFSISIGDNTFFIEGEIKATAFFECSRCLKEIELTLVDYFEDTIESLAEEIDIKPIIKETLSMMEPLRTVCKSKCDETLLDKYAQAEKKQKESPFSILKKEIKKEK